MLTVVPHRQRAARVRDERWLERRLRTLGYIEGYRGILPTSSGEAYFEGWTRGFKQANITTTPARTARDETEAR